jgi:hypothetical protein
MLCESKLDQAEIMVTLALRESDVLNMMETINNTNVAFNFYAGCFLSICPKRSL